MWPSSSLSIARAPERSPTRTRVERAKQLLSDSSRTVSDVAREVGYDDAGYFSRVFKKVTGRTPVAYRKA